MMDCLFCNIVNRTLHSHIIFEDDHVIAFDDIRPQAPYHELIIPKKHIASLNDLDDHQQNLVGHLVLVGKALANQLGIAEDGYRLLFNCNAQGGQEVYHVHLHLLGGRQMHWPPG
jgi:histidine triad (HIT) family protein